MLLFRRATLFGAAVLALAACSAPDTNGLFEPARGAVGPADVPQGCIDRCRGAALRCTLLDAPCDALCGSVALSDSQLNCLEGARCDTEGSPSIIDRCLNQGGAALGLLGARCNCVDGSVSCQANCIDGLTCFDPGGINDTTPPLFPGFCSLPCDGPGGRGGSCPSGFVCREQIISGQPAPGENKFWCER
jgi:hypothetical protein